MYMQVVLKGIVLADINSPFNGDFQNCTCKSYPEEMFIGHSSSPLKGDFQNYTCKSDQEVLFLAHSSSPLKGDF